jgi:hypothetical protein
MPNPDTRPDIRPKVREPETPASTLERPDLGEDEVNSPPAPPEKDPLTKAAGKVVGFINASWSRISNIKGLFMILFGLLIDGIQIFLVAAIVGFFINWTLTIIAWLSIAAWYKISKVSIFDSPVKLATFTLTALIDVIPGTELTVLFSFPWTVGTIIMILIVRFEDLVGVRIPTPGSLKKGAAKGVAGAAKEIGEEVIK